MKYTPLIHSGIAHRDEGRALSVVSYRHFAQSDERISIVRFFFRRRGELQRLQPQPEFRRESGWSGVATGDG
jgi:hypothetical protein